MEKIILPHGEIELVQPGNILYISFYGDIPEKEYKNIWETTVSVAVKEKLERFVFDQSEVGKVGFSARGWVIVKMLPRIKKELGTDIKTGVVSSKSIVNKTGLKYLVGMFEKMVGLKIHFFNDKDVAISSISKI